MAIAILAGVIILIVLGKLGQSKLRLSEDMRPTAEYLLTDPVPIPVGLTIYPEAGGTVWLSEFDGIVVSWFSEIEYRMSITIDGREIHDDDISFYCIEDCWYVARPGMETGIHLVQVHLAHRITGEAIYYEWAFTLTE